MYNNSATKINFQNLETVKIFKRNKEHNHGIKFPKPTLNKPINSVVKKSRQKKSSEKVVLSVIYKLINLIIITKNGALQNETIPQYIQINRTCAILI